VHAIASLADVRSLLGEWRDAPARAASGAWSPAQVLEHCAQSIDCSLHGFPVLKSAFVRGFVGPLVLRRFLAKGRMTHDHAAQIPGLEPPVERPWADAVARLLASIAAFEAWTGATAPHVVFGRVEKDRYARYHALHIADHFADFAAAASAAR
jgi:hypothetical protein